MSNYMSARKTVRAISVTAIVLMLAACGSDPVPVPAPPSGNGYGGGIGLGSCGGVSGAQPVQPAGTAGYYGDLYSQNPTSSGDIFISAFYQRIPTAGYQAENIVGAGAVKIPALTGYYQNSVIPVCVSSNNNSPGQINAASGGIKIKMTGPLPVLPQGTIPGGSIPISYGMPYGYQQTQSMGSVEVRVGWSCPAWVVPQGRVLGCVDVISYGYPGGSMSYNIQ